MNWNKYKLTSITGAALFAFCGSALGLEGPVRGQWSGPGNILITGNISLGSNDTLRIDPGVVISFQGNYGFDIRGKLLAEGTEREPITFTGPGQPGGWGGLALSGPGADRSLISWVTVQFAQQGFNLDDTDPPISNCTILRSTTGIRLIRSQSIVTNCTISDVTANGVGIGGGSTAQIRNCRITRTGNHGISVGESATPRVVGNIIMETADHGISLATAAPCSLLWNIIIRPGERGISIDQSNGVKIMRNVVFQSGGPGLWIYRSTGLQIINNTIIGSQTSHGLQVSSNASGQLTNNIIMDHRRSGLYVENSNIVNTYNDILNNRENDYGGQAQAGEHEIHVSPNLGNPDELDFNPRAGSPIIDRGDPFSDPDPDGTTADIGAGFYNQNRPPVIDSLTPEWPPDTTVTGDMAYRFYVEASDPDGQFLSYTWSVDGAVLWRTESFSHEFRRDGEYTVKVIVSDRYYLGTVERLWRFYVEGSAVKSEPGLPEGYELSAAYPNPFNGVVRVAVTLPIASIVELALVDMTGRVVVPAYEERLGAGTHSITFDATALPTGEYLIRANLGGSMAHRKVVLLK